MGVCTVGSPCMTPSTGADAILRRAVAAGLTLWFYCTVLLVCFAALRSMPVMPKLEHYNVDAMHAMVAAALATKADAANARARPRLAGPM